MFKIAPRMSAILDLGGVSVKICLASPPILIVLTNTIILSYYMANSVDKQGFYGWILKICHRVSISHVEREICADDNAIYTNRIDEVAQILCVIDQGIKIQGFEIFAR